MFTTESIAIPLLGLRQKFASNSGNFGAKIREAVSQESTWEELKLLNVFLDHCLSQDLMFSLADGTAI